MNVRAILPSDPGNHRAPVPAAILEAAQARGPDYPLIPIERLIESPTNPRRSFEGLDELAESIRCHGVLVPLLVRPAPSKPDCYEVVAGARRLRAARKAGLKRLPALIRPQLSDQETAEIQLIENLQRAGLHPLEEAAAYAGLLDRAGLTQAEIAQRIGRSQQHISQRLALLHLTAEAEREYRAQRISTAQAILICRLDPEDQRRVLKHIQSEWRGVNVSARQLATWLDEEIYRRLDTAPFDLADATLVAAAGACKDCPRRTSRWLDPAKSGRHADKCMHPACWAKKVQAHIERTIRAWESAGRRYARVSVDCGGGERPPAGVLTPREFHTIEPDTAGCPSAVSAIVVHAPGWRRNEVGQRITICADKRCPKHQGRRLLGAKSGAAEASGAGRARRQRQELLRWLLAEIAARVKAPLAPPDLRLVALAWFESAGQERRLAICRQERIDPAAHPAQPGFQDYLRGFEAHLARLSTVEIHRLLLVMALISDLVWDGRPGQTRIERLAAERGIRVEDIRSQALRAVGASK